MLCQEIKILHIYLVFFPLDPFLGETLAVCLCKLTLKQSVKNSLPIPPNLLTLIISAKASMFNASSNESFLSKVSRNKSNICCFLSLGSIVFSNVSNSSKTKTPSPLSSYFLKMPLICSLSFCFQTSHSARKALMKDTLDMV